VAPKIFGSALIMSLNFTLILAPKNIAYFNLIDLFLWIKDSLPLYSNIYIQCLKNVYPIRPGNLGKKIGVQ